MQIELEIVYRDEWLIAVNKPSGMLVHRSWLDKGETRFVMQTLRDQIGQHVFPLHRLDRPTSGVLLFALSSEMAAEMMPKFAGRDIHKTYHAVVRGWIQDGATLDYPLKEELDKIADKKATKEPEAKEAITEYMPIAHGELPIAMGRYQSCRYTLVEMKPRTGRKHQLRRHMHHLSHHIVGDVNHGDGRHNRLFRQEFDCHQLLLHASRTEFTHPVTNEKVVVEASVDPVWRRVLDGLGWQDQL
ncbi:tRNA pseudouridine(65) synthase TruC [Enterovibrio sp. ZSDZ35]|uniref:tRNA pseudouridine synthase C n=1 Tax=Enterovibrio qingdaonensis TaxID=2899818 RepID=A0ABT5QSU8_9GAMM|nr:tRNA pseudouridine(65) synthase TruC [Enterovibrio sp. ZSDZ35]MDD1783768.1 tRNA pseudouridine(65) synthase TruC [Enterovibrio sp. ZSDZ35]